MKVKLKYDFSHAVDILDSAAEMLEECTGLHLDEHGAYETDNTNALITAANIESLRKAISVLREYESDHKEDFV